MPRRAQRNGDLDELDHSIIRLLRSDGRMTYAELAKELGAVEGTVRKRFQRLVSNGHLQIVAMIRLEHSGVPHDVRIGLRVEPACIWSVAEKVATFEQIRWVGICTGEADVMMSAGFESTDELLSFLTNELGKVPGILTITTSHVLRHVKRNYTWIEDEDFGR